MNWQLQCEHITELILEMTLYVFLISNGFITKEMGSTEKNHKQTNIEKVVVI